MLLQSMLQSSTVEESYYSKQLMQGHCYRAWLSSDPRSELASGIASSATVAEHGWQLISAAH